jgi:ATP phosphoribosyltransferase
MGDLVKLALPKGRMYQKVVDLLSDAGYEICGNGLCYRPRCGDPRFQVKILKPQNIPSMVEVGSQDAAFAGYDWIVELGADVTELLDTGLDPVRVVAAMPTGLHGLDSLRGRRIVLASEYERLSREFIEAEGLDCAFVRSYGATEVFPPEDADLIVDCTATGRTLAENSLEEVSCLLSSTTRFISGRAAMSGPGRDLISEMAVLLKSVLDARRRVMLEMNVAPSSLQAVLAVLPCMREPTVSPLAGDSGFAVKAAVPRSEVPGLISLLKEAGATDLLEYHFTKVVL